MNLRKMGYVVGLALVLGSIISLLLPSDEQNVVEQLFNEVNFQRQELGLALERMSATGARINRNEGALENQAVLREEGQALLLEMTAVNQDVVEWGRDFASGGEGELETQKVLLFELREQAPELLEQVRTLDRKGRILLGDPGAS